MRLYTSPRARRPKGEENSLNTLEVERLLLQTLAAAWLNLQLARSVSETLARLQQSAVDPGRRARESCEGEESETREMLSSAAAARQSRRVELGVKRQEMDKK